MTTSPSIQSTPWRPSVAVPIGAGLLAGVAASLVVSSIILRHHERALSAEPSVAPLPRFWPAPAPRAVTDNRVGRLADQVGALEEQMARMREDRATAAPPPVEEPAEVWHEREIAKHEAEMRTQPWAERLEKSISSALRANGATRGYQLTSVDCRSKTCLASLAWPSFTQALATYDGAASVFLDPPCGTQIILPDPPDRNAPYQAKLLLRCDPSGGRAP